MNDTQQSRRLDSALFITVAFVMAFLLLLLSFNLTFQYLNYRDGIRASLSMSAKFDHLSILTYSRAWDFAVAKTSALFLSFLLIFLGSLYVLRSTETAFAFEAATTALRGSLSTSSPGLVMIFLGVILVMFVVANKSTIDYAPKVAVEGPKKPISENASKVPVTSSLEEEQK